MNEQKKRKKDMKVCCFEAQNGKKTKDLRKQTYTQAEKLCKLWSFLALRSKK